MMWISKGENIHVKNIKNTATFKTFIFSLNYVFRVLACKYLESYKCLFWKHSNINYKCFHLYSIIYLLLFIFILYFRIDHYYKSIYFGQNETRGIFYRLWTSKGFSNLFLFQWKSGLFTCSYLFLIPVNNNIAGGLSNYSVWVF